MGSPSEIMARALTQDDAQESAAGHNRIPFQGAGSTTDAVIALCTNVMAASGDRWRSL